MSEIREDLKYVESHEWVRVEGDIAVCGVSDHAQHLMTDVVFVELPEVDEDIAKGESIVNIESVKAVSEVYAPVSGEIIEVNEALEDAPELINSDPFGEGWIFKIRMSDAGEVDSLLSAVAYRETVEA